MLAVKDAPNTIWTAAATNDAQMLQTLLDSGTHPDEKSTDRRPGRTALHVAAENNSAEVIKILVAVGANVNVADNEGQTPLLFCTGAGNTDTMQVLTSTNSTLTLIT